MGRGCAHGVFTLEEHFRGPAGYAGVPGAHGPTPLGHLVIWAADDRESSGAVAGCPSAQIAGASNVNGRIAHWYRCQGGVHSGHVMLVWRRSHTTYSVSAHGQTETNRRLLRRVADGLDYVGHS